MINKRIKITIGILLIASMTLPSYASLSASDGSAFVTKSEFDSVLSDFSSRLTTFEAGINSKIDSQVTSYLDRNGIWSGQRQDWEPYYVDGSGNPVEWRKLTWDDIDKTNYGQYLKSTYPGYDNGLVEYRNQEYWVSASLYSKYLSDDCFGKPPTGKNWGNMGSKAIKSEDATWPKYLGTDIFYDGSVLHNPPYYPMWRFKAQKSGMHRFTLGMETGWFESNVQDRYTASIGVLEIGQQNTHGNTLKWVDASMFPGPPFLEQKNLWVSDLTSVTADGHTIKSLDNSKSVTLNYRRETPGTAVACAYFVKKDNWYSIGLFITSTKGTERYYHWYPQYYYWISGLSHPWPWISYNRNSTSRASSGGTNETYVEGQANKPLVAMPWTVFDSQIY